MGAETPFPVLRKPAVMAQPFNPQARLWKLSLVFSFLRSLGFKSLPCTWFTTTDILRKLLSWVGLFQTDDSSNSASLEMDLATLSVTKASFTPHLPGDFRGVTNVGWAGINQKDQSKGGSTIVPATCLRKMDMPGPRNWSRLGKEVLTSTTGCASLDLSSPTWESLWPHHLSPWLQL